MSNFSGWLGTVIKLRAKKISCKVVTFILPKNTQNKFVHLLKIWYHTSLHDPKLSNAGYPFLHLKPVNKMLFGTVWRKLKSIQSGLPPLSPSYEETGQVVQKLIEAERERHTHTHTFIYWPCQLLRLNGSGGRWIK